MNRALVLLPLAVACTEATFDGTAVGNLDATLRITTPLAADVDELSGAVAVAELSIVDSDGSSTLIASGVEVSLVGGTTLALPPGGWCELVLRPAATAIWNGTSTAAFVFDVEVDLGVLRISRTLPFDTTITLPLVWQLGASPWLNAAAIGADQGDVTVGPGDPAHDGLASSAGVGVLFRDDDGDSVPDPGEEELKSPTLEDAPAP